MDMLGGSLQIDSQVGQGARLVLDVPTGAE
jgi:hypothetical protein